MTDDLFGDALRRHHRREGDGWVAFERDDERILTQRLDVFFARAPLWIETQVMPGGAARVLDVGCGAGRHLLWAEARGRTATGLDSSPGAVEVARARGARDVRRLDVMADDLPGDLTGFDLILLMGHNIGIGGDIAGATALLRTLAARLSSGGHICLTSQDVSPTDDPGHLAYQRANLAAGRPEGQMRLRFVDGDATGPWFRWLHLGPDAMRAIAADAGLAVAQVVRFPHHPGLDHRPGTGTYAMRLALA